MGAPNWSNRTLFHGDNLKFLRGMNSESVDLIATDPPFNKSRDFHATPDSLAAGASFQDRWSWEKDTHQDWVDQITDDYPRLMEAIESARYAHSDGMGAFMCFMAVRLLEMHRILRSAGSIYLHCDPTASHYLKAVMDAIFGHKKFMSEVIWNRAQVKGDSKRKFAANHDAILVYSNGRSHTFNPVYDEQDVEYQSRFSKNDNDGRGAYRLAPLDSPNPRPNLTYVYKGYSPPGKGWRVSLDVMRELDRDGRLAFPKAPGGRIARKHYLREQKGPMIGDVWTDIGPLQSGRERVGFPTQKPVGLYSRMILSSTKQGDVVLDPFAGCATTLVAAEQEGRQWVGVDIWDKAHEVVVERLKQEGLAADGDSAGKLAFGDIHYTTEPPTRTDDGEAAAPNLRTKIKMFEPPGQKMSRAAMYKHLLGQNGPRCQGCDRVFDDPRYLDLDHNTPRTDGGINHISNRILLCGPCNRLKSNTFTLSGLRKQNKKNGYMAGSEGEHPLMREIREERENAPPTLFD